MSIKVRLSIMMFLYYFAIGAFHPILSLYFKTYLHFSGYQTGLILSMSAGTAIISPLIGAFVADRLISSERLLSLIMFAGGCFLLLLSYQTAFNRVFLFYSLYILLFGPAIALTNAICFHQLHNTSHDFGRIRTWGTIGWIVAGWLFSYLWLRGPEGMIYTERIVDALRLGGFSAFVLGIFAFWLPSIKGELEQSAAPGQKSFTLFPAQSFAIFLNPSILLLCFCALLFAIADRYYYYGISIFLKQTGLSPETIMPVMTIGQVPEVFGMVLLGFFLHRFGVKAAFIVGTLTQFIRFVLLAWGNPFPVILAGVSCHGFTIAFFSITLFIYLDKNSSPGARTGVHQLFAIVTSGLGAFLGNQLSGYTADLFTDPVSKTINFVNFWSVPAVISFCILGVIFLFFSDKKPKNSQGKIAAIQAFT